MKTATMAGYINRVVDNELAEAERICVELVKMVEGL